MNSPKSRLTSDDLQADMTATELSEYLSTQDDFALEIRVFEAAKRVGLPIVHGGSYEDPYLNKPRQFDLRARVQVKTPDGERGFLHLALECKNLQKSYPLLVSRLKRESQEAMHYIIESTDGYGQGQVQLRSRSFVYERGQWVGKSMAQVGRTADRTIKWRTSDSDVFDKWMQSVNSCIDLIKDAIVSGGKFKAAVIPVLVVANGALWVVDYDDDGQVIGAPRQVDETTFYIDRQVSMTVGSTDHRMRISHLHIMTEDKIKRFFQQIMDRDIVTELFFID